MLCLTHRSSGGSVGGRHQPKPAGPATGAAHQMNSRFRSSCSRPPFARGLGRDRRRELAARPPLPPRSVLNGGACQEALFASMSPRSIIPAKVTAAAALARTACFECHMPQVGADDFLDRSDGIECHASQTGAGRERRSMRILPGHHSIVGTKRALPSPRFRVGSTSSRSTDVAKTMIAGEQFNLACSNCLVVDTPAGRSRRRCGG